MYMMEVDYVHVCVCVYVCVCACVCARACVYAYMTHLQRVYMYLHTAVTRRKGLSKFSKVLPIVAFNSKCTRALTFENVCQVIDSLSGTELGEVLFPVHKVAEKGSVQVCFLGARIVVLKGRVWFRCVCVLVLSFCARTLSLSLSFSLSFSLSLPPSLPPSHSLCLSNSLTHTLSS